MLVEVGRTTRVNGSTRRNIGDLQTSSAYHVVCAWCTDLKARHHVLTMSSSITGPSLYDFTDLVIPIPVHLNALMPRLVGLVLHHKVIEGRFGGTVTNITASLSITTTVGQHGEVPAL